MRQKRCFRLTLHGQKYVDIPENLRNKPEFTGAINKDGGRGEKQSDSVFLGRTSSGFVPH